MPFMRNYRFLLWSLASMQAVVFAASPDFEQTRADFEHMANKMPYLDLRCVLFDATDQLFEVADPRKKTEHFEVIKQASDPKYSKEALLRILKHDDSKVRTLAAVALFEREDPLVLPELVGLCDDGSPTFDGHPELKASRPPMSVDGTMGLVSGSAPPQLKQNVSHIVRAMVRCYMEPAGFHYGVKDSSEPGFSEYWGARKNRLYCAGWFAVQLERACRGTSGKYPDTAERIQKLRQRIDRIPPDDRTWVLLWLNGEMGSDILVTEAELLDLCGSLGADKLMLMLQNKIPTDDPDLQPRSNGNWFYERMSHFVLRHSDQLLRAEDSEKLIPCENLARACRTPLWAIAAAGLNQERASQILHESMSRFQGRFDSVERADICAAMWRLGRDREAGFILDWFYKEKPDLTSAGGRGRFISDIGSQKSGRQMIYRLIQDPRFAEIGWEALVEIVRVVNRWSDKPVVTEDEIREAWHPFHIGQFDARQAEAIEKYPNVTAELLGHLGQWRERLRAFAPKLNNVKE